MGYTNSSMVSYTKLSPNHSGQRTHSIDRITPHCVVGQCSVETLGNIFLPASRQASSNYGIGVDGRVGMYVEEKNRSWCSSSNANDQRAVTIECASDTKSPYAFKDAVYQTLIKLCVDICKRNGKEKLLYDGEEKCSTPHLTEDEIKAMFVTAANKLIGKKAAIISPLRASLDIAFDTSALEAETEKLQEELMVASDLIQKCIYENAHVALDQTEYQKRYDGLTARFDSAKAQLEEIDSAIADKKSRRAAIEAFLDTLAQADLMEKFDPALWCGLVDFVAVYDKDDVRITFKNGQEIKT